MAFFTPEKRIQLQSYIEAGLVAATELARKLGCCARTARRESDRRRALKLEEWIRYQFDMSRWNDEREDRIRCGLLYGISPIYIGWESRYQTRPVKRMT